MDAGLVVWLRQAEHDVMYMAEIAPAESDTDIARRAREGERLVLTEDKDFGDLISRRRLNVPGLVLSRIDPAMHALKRKRLAAAIAWFGDDLSGRYTIVEEARFRSRPLRRQ